MSTILILLASIGLATTGQLLLKSGMNSVGAISIGALEPADVLPLVGRVMRTWQVPLGLGMFSLSAGAWLVVLSRIPLSTAYPVVSLSYVLILLFSVTLLGERPPLLVWSGATLVVTGIILIGLGHR